MALPDNGEIIELELDDLAYGGDCIGHQEDGYTIFVSGGVPGEKVNVKLLKKKKSYARGKIVKILQPSSERIKPDCKVYNECGGCQLQHMTYEAELKYKKKIIEDLMIHIAKIKKVKVENVLGSNFPWYYRNKAQFPLTVDIDNITAGFYRRGTHDLISVEECKIQHPLINRIKKYTLNLLNKYDLTVYDEKRHYGLLRHLVIRVGVCTNQAILNIVTYNQFFPKKHEIAEELVNRIPELTGVLQNINQQNTNVIMGDELILLAGEKTYIDYIGEMKYRISPSSFFQVNTLQTKKLYDIIRKFCGRTTGTILDCYCGIGSISIYLAKYAEKIYGIEENDAAVKDARLNAALNQIENCIFIQGKVEEKLSVDSIKKINPDIVIFDPPRKGLKDEVVELILTSGIEKIIYVSCNPSTLARDIKKLIGKYSVTNIQPVDMFPQTYHVETVVLLSLNKREAIR